MSEKLEEEKRIVAEDPDEDYEADNYEDDEEETEETKQESQPMPRMLTRVTEKQMPVKEMKSV